MPTGSEDGRRDKHGQDCQVGTVSGLLEERQDQQSRLLIRVEEESRREVGRIEGVAIDSEKRLQSIETELAITIHDVKKNEKRLDDLLSRR